LVSTDWLLRDVRYALRSLARTRGFTTVAILTLALGISANTVVFSFLDALILRPLPIPHPESVFFVQTAGTFSHSFPNYRDLRDRNLTFSELAGYRLAWMAVDGGADPVPTWGYLATGNYFNLLGLQPVRGRFFSPNDDVTRGGSPYAVLSYAYWQRQFDGDPDVVGRTIRINGLPYTVVGVAPRDFNGTEVFFRPDLWVPMTMQAQIEGRLSLDERRTSNTLVIGRMRNGVTREQAETDLNTVAAAMAAENPTINGRLRLALATPGLWGDTLRGPVSAFVGAVMALAVLVLLAACANLASILAVRVIDRFRELAIRTSIGATRGHILRQVAIETLLLCSVGGAAGLGVAVIALRTLSRWHGPMGLPVQLDVTPDASVFGFAVAASLIAALFAVIAPVRRAARSNAADLMRQGASPVGWRRWSSRDVLLGLQLALCCVLITACFVSLRGLTRALAVPLGFDPRGVTVSIFDLGQGGYTPAEGRAFQSRALDAVRALPGIAEAAYASALPLTTDQSTTTVFQESTVDFGPANAISAPYYHVSPGYFHLMRTRLLAGREFSVFDTPDSPRVAIVNETFARRVIGTSDAVGRRFRLGAGSNDLREVVGVVEDGKYFSLSEEPRPTVFWPAAAAYNSSTVIAVRSTLPSGEVTSQLRRIIRNLDPRVSLQADGTVTDANALFFLPARAATIALGAFGLLAISLALIGIYGLAAYSVSARVREIGIRVAIGARSHDVLRSILGRTAVVLAAGACAGIAAGMAVSQLLKAVVYHATPGDPVVIAATACTVALVGLGAAWVPARRALAVDPAQTLRDS
jgi:predicted permease